jgi:hypothetical protein
MDEINLEGVINIKFLKILETDIKNSIKTDKNKIKIIQKILTDYEPELKNIERNITVILKDHNRHNRMVCEKCGNKFYNKELFNKHNKTNCKYKKNALDYDRTLAKYLYGRDSINRDIKYKQQDINRIDQKIKRCNQTLINVSELIKQLSKICNKCNKDNEPLVKSIKCDYNHILCDGCLDTSKCPICVQQLCLICMNKLETISCTKKHSICYECLTKINQIYTECPFCNSNYN